MRSRYLSVPVISILLRNSEPPVVKTDEYNHTSFSFTDEDVVLLDYCAEKTGLSRTELMRRAIRILASGTKLPTLAAIPGHAAAKKWLKDYDA